VSHLLRTLIKLKFNGKFFLIKSSNLIKKIFKIDKIYSYSI